MIQSGAQPVCRPQTAGSQEKCPASPPGRRGLLPDTHAHLDAGEFDADRAEVVARACDLGISRILAVGTDLASSRAAVALAAEFEPVYAAVGIHPTEIHKWESEAEGVHALLSALKVVAVGEVGLDFVRGTDTKQVQLAAFRTQLRWAAERGVAVSVHNRGADNEIIAVLAESPVRAILHCFSGSPDFADVALAGGHTLSFAGNVTFPRAEALRAVAAAVPEDRLLTESDAPVLAPQPWRGRRNEPAYTRATAETIAAARATSLETLASSVSETADRLFRWGMA
jgi:TatD DNase family protein